MKPFVRLALLCASLAAPLVASLPQAAAAGSMHQSITIYPIADQTLDAAPFQVLAVPDSNLPVTLSVNGPATLSGRLLTLTGTGLVTLSASQAGNAQFAPATTQLSFHVRPAVPVVSWTPPSLVYGTPLPLSALNATAAAAPVVNLAADAATLSARLYTSAITGVTAVTVPASSSVLRYEGSSVGPGNIASAPGGYVSTGAQAPLGLPYRVAFTCTCSEFELALQSGQGSYRVWVDGQWTSIDATDQLRNSPAPAFYRVQFPNRRPRQIKVAVIGDPAFFGLVTAPGDTITAPQVPLGPRVMIFGDSWTGPTIVAPVYGPPQAGLNGSGYPQVLGEYFNWDYWDSGVGGEGFTVAGTDGNGQAFPGRALTDICGRAPAATIIMGGVNDGGATALQVGEAAATVFSELASCLPSTITAVYGPQIPYDSITMEEGLAGAANYFGAVTYTDMAAQQWLYGNPYDPSIGNGYLYFGGHPTPLGHDYLAEKIALDILGKAPVLAPQPYTLFTPTAIPGNYSYSVIPGQLLPAGPQPVSVTFVPQDYDSYATVTAGAVLPIQKAATTTTLFASSVGAPGTALLSAQVSPQFSGVPSGLLTFSINGVAVATLTLNSSGAASFAASGLPKGVDSVTANYAGDQNFNPSGGSGSVSIKQ